MTHAELCALAVKWLKRPNSAGGPGCAVAVSECRSGWDGEIPDAIGFRATDGSTVVEVKVSRADFLADRNKPHRQSGGMGRWRYYMAPAGLIAIADLPLGWGLIEVNQRGHIKARAGLATYYAGRYDEAQRQAILWQHESDADRERFLLVRVLANVGDPQKLLGMLRDANNRNASLVRSLEDLRAKLERRELRHEQVGAVSAIPRKKSVATNEATIW